MASTEGRFGRIRRKTRGRLQTIRIPIRFVGLTGLGLVVLSAAPFLGLTVALHSARNLAPLDPTDLPRALFQIAVYWVFPGDFNNWFDTSWAVFLMSLIVADRLSHRLYVTAFAAGAVAGGLTFVLTGPTSSLIGPGMAAWGLAGFYCVTTLYSWKTLHWVARLYSLLVYAVAVLTTINAFTNPTATSAAEVTALAASLLLAAHLLRRARLTERTGVRPVVEAAQA